MSVLVDTSVWVRHFRRADPELAALLGTDQVLVHPLVLGEIGCGTPPMRPLTLGLLATQQQPAAPSLGEVMSFVEREALFGLGCGLVDLTLLASTLMTPGAQLWTLDARLNALATRFGVRHPALPN